MINNIPILFVFNENYAMGASVTIQSLLASKKASTSYEIFALIDDEIKNETIEKISTIAPITWIKIDKKKFVNIFPSSKRFPLINSYRLIAPELFTDLDKIIVCDTDVMITRDLSDIYNIDLTGLPLGAVAEAINDEGLIKEYPLARFMTCPYRFTAGFMVMNLDKMRQDGWGLKKFAKIAREYWEEIDYMEMDILNLACENIYLIPAWYFLPQFVYYDNNAGAIYGSYIYGEYSLKEIKKNAAVIHYSYGDNSKIWQQPEEDIPEDFLRYMRSSPLYEKSI